MLDVVSWYIAIQALGILAFPAAFVLFRRLPDRGFTLAKPAAMVFFAYILWVLGLTHIAPNTQLTIVLILGVAAVPSIYLFVRNLSEIVDFVRENWSVMVVAEVLFIGFFLVWLAIVSEVPAINHTEKPMDFGFMNAVLQSRFFPVEDPWLSGNNISYYYFGHFMMAFLTQLSGVASSVGYNLGVSLVPALVAAGAFGLVYNLVRISGGSLRAGLVFGAAGPVLILMAGNLEGIMEFVNLRGWGTEGFWERVGIKGLTGAETGSGAFPDSVWWWFRSTRVIDTLAGSQSLDYTITEFPLFSFILGDLHPHVMNLPFVILGLGLTLNLFLSEERMGIYWLRDNLLEAAAIALFIGSLAFINIWDFPVIAAIFGATVLVKAYGDFEGDLAEAARSAAAVIAPVLILAVVLFIPFYLDFDAATSGILPLRDVNTRPFLLFLVMGPLILLVISFLIRQITALTRPSDSDSSAAVLVMIVVATPFLIWVGAAFIVTWIDDGTSAAFGEIGGRAILVLPGLALVGLAGFSALQRTRLENGLATAFPLLLAGMAFYLLVGAELFYVVDQFGGGFRRMNTVFKTYYQAWLLLGIVGAYGLYYLWSLRPEAEGFFEAGSAVFDRMIKVGRVAWISAAVVLLVASLYYPIGAVLDRTGVFQEGHTISDNTLDGLAFLKQSSPGEYAAIEWLRDDAPRGRMVEAVGDDYSDFARISSSTGLPTVLGWKGHERQWRSSSSSLGSREDDVRTIFSSDDSDEVRRLLDSYEVRYVYLGSRERQTYGGKNLADFDFLRTVREWDGVIVYEMVQPTVQNR
jgi:YYY domain-containing protein